MGHIFKTLVLFTNGVSKAACPTLWLLILSSYSKLHTPVPSCGLALMKCM